MPEPRRAFHDHDCIHDDDFARLESLISKVFGKMDEFIDEMHAIIVSDATRQARVDQHDRDIDRAFDEIRAIASDVKAIDKWKNRFDGGVKVMLAIPVLCAVITTTIAVYSLLRVSGG